MSERGTETTPMSPPGLLVVVPVLGRPHRAAPLVQSLTEATATGWRLVFVCSPDDLEQQWECDQLAFRHPNIDVVVTDRPAGPGDYARKIQQGYETGTEPYVLLAADDLRFHPGWDTQAVALMDEFDVGVVGTVDLGNQTTMRGTHSTHPLVARCYINTHGGVVGEPGTVYHEGYDHQWVDTELVETAKARGCYAHCHAAVVEHFHPFWGKAEMDATYRRGMAGSAADRRLFESRRHLWERTAVTA